MRRMYLITLHILYLSYSIGQIDTSQTSYTVQNINISNQYGKQGKWSFIDKNNIQKNCKVYYVNDTLNGFFEFSNNGKLVSTGYYKNGLLDSVLTGFEENRRIRAIINYKNGLKHGIAIFYNDTGKVIVKKSYINGEEDVLYSEAYTDSNAVFDINPSDYNPFLNIEIDSTEFKYPLYYHLYANKVMNPNNMRKMRYSKGRMIEKSYYENGVLKRTLIFSKKRPYSIEQIHNYVNGEYSFTTDLRKKRKKFFLF